MMIEMSDFLRSLILLSKLYTNWNIISPYSRTYLSVIWLNLSSRNCSLAERGLLPWLAKGAKEFRFFKGCTLRDMLL
jgi:hypothetical protein